MHKKRVDFLLTEIAKNNSKALEELYFEMKNGIYAFIYPYFNNRADAEDCLQTVFMKISAKAANYTPQTNGVAWILQLAKNEALDEKRKGSRVVYGEFGEQPQDIRPSFVFDAMQRALDPDENEIVVLHVLWGYKHREIAKLKGLPVGTVTSKYKRAVDKLKKELKEKGE